MKKNLILFIVISLVAVSLVSAAPWSGWFNGNAVESGNRNTANLGEGQISMFEGEIREVEGYTLTVISINDGSSIIDVDGVSEEISEGSSQVINGFELTLIGSSESWWRRNYVMIKVESSGHEITPGAAIIPHDNDDDEEEEEGELSYVGILSMLNNAEPTGQFLLGLSSNNGSIIQSMGGDQYCGEAKTCLFGYLVINFPNTPYFGSEGHSLIGCQTTYDLETIQRHDDWVNGSTISLQYMCIDNPSEGNMIAGGWSCIECSSPGQCGTYGTCLSTGCCGGTAPSGLTDGQTN
jgi:hypothetical protein